MNEINERKIASDEYNSEFSYNENKSNIKISFMASEFSSILKFYMNVYYLLTKCNSSYLCRPCDKSTIKIYGGETCIIEFI